jgi:uncharacterized protein YbbK (DUF523 family)
MGEACRYDGGACPSRELGELPQNWQLVSCCPERELGMGVPRAPITFVEGPDGRRLVCRVSQKDWTDAMREWCDTKVLALLASGLDGAILKSASPSCGIADAECFRSVDAFVQHGLLAAGESPRDLALDESQLGHDASGMLVKALLIHAPGLPLISEQELKQIDAREVFLERVRLRAAASRP